MNGFERSSGQDAEADALEPLFPTDFTSEEIAFATELREVFAVEREDLPPLYVQTLMEREWDDLAAAEQQRVLIPRVFDRLGLSREPISIRLPLLPALPSLRAFPSLPSLPTLPSWSSVVESASQLATTSRTLIATAAAVVAVMVFSVLLTTPSFAQGLQILLGHTGVQQVGSYPGGAQDDVYAPGPMTPGPANILWLGPQVGDYKYQATYLLKPEPWSQGPIVDVRYAMPGKTRGDGILDIREFLVSAKYEAVLQIVQVGAASEVQLGNGESAVFVNGMWKQTNSHMAWSYGSRSELISEQSGVVCWMVADPRDGMGSIDLIDAAGHFQLTPSPFRAPHQIGVNEIGSELTPWLRNASDGELYRLVPAGESLSSGMGSLVLLRGSPNAPLSSDGTGVSGAN